MEVQASQDVLIKRINRLLRLIKNLNESIDLRKEYNDSNFMIEQDVSLKSTFEKELFELLAQMKITLPFQKAA